MSRTDNLSTRQSFLSHAFIYGFGALLLQSASIVLLPLYLNYLEPADYGILEVLTRLGDFVVIGLMANGFRMAALTFYQQATSPREQQQIAATILTALFATIALGIALVFGFADFLMKLLAIDNHQLFTLGVCTVLLEALTMIPLVLMQARLQSLRYVVTIISIFLFRVLLTITLVAWAELGIWGIFYARISTAVIFGTILNLLELLRSSFVPSWRDLKSVFRFALPFLPGGILAFFINNGDRFYLVKYWGDHAVGIYALAYKASTFITMLAVIPLYQVWSAKMYHVARQPDAAQVFGRVYQGLATLFLVVALFTCLFARETIILFGGTRYLACLGQLPILALAAFFLMSSDLFDAGIYIQRKTWVKPLILLASATAILVAYYLLIPRYGGYGAAIATVIGMFVQMTVTWLVSQRIFYVHYEFSRIGASLAVAIGLYLTGLLVMDWGWSGLMLRVGCWLGFLGFLWFASTSTERNFLITNLMRMQADFGLKRMRLKWFSKS